MENDAQGVGSVAVRHEALLWVAVLGTNFTAAIAELWCGVGKPDEYATVEAQQVNRIADFYRARISVELIAVGRSGLKNEERAEAACFLLENGVDVLDSHSRIRRFNLVTKSVLSNREHGLYAAVQSADREQGCADNPDHPL